MPSLYNCRHDGDQYRITKFDSDWNVEASYLCDLHSCECPAGHRSRCRHREMLPKFIQRGHIGDEWFWDHDRGGWVQGASVEMEPSQTVATQREVLIDDSDMAWAASAAELGQASETKPFLDGISQSITSTMIYTTNEPPFPIVRVDLRVPVEPDPPEPTKHEFRLPPSPTIRRRV